MGLRARGKSLTISLAVWIQCTSVTDGQTDRHRPTADTALTHSVAWLKHRALYAMHGDARLNGSVKEPIISIYFFFRPSLNGVLFPMIGFTGVVPDFSVVKYY